MKAGFYECDITPPLGAERPGDYAKRWVENICDPLKTRAVVFTDGKLQIALVGIDAIGCSERFLHQLESACPGIKIILSASHCHYGGNVRDEVVPESEKSELIRRLVQEDSVACDPVYRDHCLRQTITAVKMAARRMEEAEFSFGKGRVKDLIFNRRIRMKDGSTLTHPGKGNPDSLDYAGPVDDELGVVGVWKKGSPELLGFLLNFSCHPDVQDDGASPDFPGLAIETVRGVFGAKAGAVFLNGPSGDVTQIDNLSMFDDIGYEISIKMGRTIGGEAIKILACAPRGNIEKLDYRQTELKLKRVPMDPKVLEEAYKKVEVNDGSNAFKIAKNRVMKSLTISRDPEPVTMLKAVQLGPLAIANTSGEMFAQYGLDFKAQAKFPFAWYAQLATNLLAYIPTEECFRKTGGGYETSISRFPPDTGARVLESVLRLTAEFTPEEPPKRKTVPPVKKVWGYNFDRIKK